MISVLLFFSSYIGGIGAAFIYSPAVIFVLYQLVYFFNPQKRWWGAMVPDLPYSFIVVATMGLLVVMTLSKKDAVKSPIPKPMKLMYWLVAIFTAAYVYAILPNLHWEYSVNFIKLAIIITLAYKLCTEEKHLDFILYGYIAGSAYIGFLAHQVGRNSYGGRVEGIGTVDSPDANGIAAAIAPSLVICLYYFWIKQSYVVKGLIAIAGAFIANGIVLINSRGAFLAVAISAAFFMWHMYFSKFQRKFQKGAAVFLTIAGLSAAVYVVDDTFVDRVKSMMQASENIENTSKETGATRVEFWKAAVRMSFDYPLGNGFLGFNMNAPQYISEDVHTGNSRQRSVHSTWFQALTEVGYHGLLVFILMLFACNKLVKETKQTLKDQNRVDEYFKIIAIQAALLSYVIAMSFMNRLLAEVLYWCVLFVCVSYNVYVQQPLLLKGIMAGKK